MTRLIDRYNYALRSSLVKNAQQNIFPSKRKRELFCVVYMFVHIYLRIRLYVCTYFFFYFFLEHRVGIVI